MIDYISIYKSVKVFIYFIGIKVTPFKYLVHRYQRMPFFLRKSLQTPCTFPGDDPYAPRKGNLFHQIFYDLSPEKRE